MLILDRVDKKLEVSIKGSSDEFYRGLDYIKKIDDAIYDDKEKVWKINPDKNILKEMNKKFKVAYKKDRYTLMNEPSPNIKTPLHFIQEEYDDIKKYYNSFDFGKMKDIPHSFQKVGIAAALYCLEKYKGFLCLDDVGLGKTIEALAVLCAMRKNFNKCIILSPKNVKYQWGEEVEKFTDFKPIVVDSYNKKKRLEKFEKPGDIYVLNHDQIKIKEDLNKMKKLNPDFLIVDEIHHFRNHETQRHKVLNSIKNLFEYKIGLTATPIANELKDLYNVINLLIDGFFGPWTNFSKKHIEYAYIYNKAIPVGYKKLFEANKKTSEISIQRQKEEIKNDLPTMHEKIHKFPISEHQKNIHNAIQNDLEIKKQALMKTDDESEEKEISESIQGLMNLQIAVANDITLLQESDSYYVREFTYNENISQDFKCPKVKYLKKLVKKILKYNKDFKIVIFSKFVKMIEVIEKEINFDYSVIIGTYSEKKVHEEKMKFIKDKNTRILLSSDAGCEGLNLQHASHLINVDMPWNPKTLKQRIGRINRLGSPWENIYISSLISKNTKEEELLDTIAKKQSLIDSVIKNTYQQKEYLKKITALMS